MGQAVAQPVGAAEREDHLALAQLRIGRERQRRQLHAVDLEQRQIQLRRDADDARGHEIRAARQRRRERAVRVVGRQHDLNPLRAVDDVRVGHDVAVGIDHEPRSDRSLTADGEAGVAPVALLARAEARDLNLHDARPHALRERVDGLVHPRERVGSRRRPLLRGGGDGEREDEQRPEQHSHAVELVAPRRQRLCDFGN